jgi:hypothetical protein
MSATRQRTLSVQVELMGRKPKPPPDDPAQSKRFIDMAREVEADERKDALERAFEKVVPGKRSPSGSK